MERTDRTGTPPDSPLRVVFFGTPTFAVPTLQRIATDARFDVALVVTQPDRPTGRGRRLESPPVKVAAAAFGLAVYQPETLRDAASRAPLESVGADLFVVAAYGRIFGTKTLGIPRIACVNVHASLLPRYRGASPITAAILAGDDQTGISLMVMEPGLDTGPVFATATEPISDIDTTASLSERLADVGGALAVEAIPAFARGAQLARAQPNVGASQVRPLVKADGQLDWTLPAVALERRVRAMWPWPRAFAAAGDGSIQVHEASSASSAGSVEPGTVLTVGGELAVACAEGALALRTVQPAGGRAMPGAALVAGRRMRVGDLLPAASTAPPPLIVPVEM